jgi:hypothetical protein
MSENSTEPRTTTRLKRRREQLGYEVSPALYHADESAERAL